MSDEKQYPPLAEQAKNLAQFSWDLIKHLQQNQNHTRLFVSDETYNERIMTCRGCDKYDELENRCRECGCYVPAKAKIILDSCPLNKWKEENSNWENIFQEIVTEINQTDNIGLDKDQKDE